MIVVQVPSQRTAVERRRDWWKSAACRGADPELFFPVSAIGPGEADAVRAKAVCAGCQVRLQCLQFALVTREPHGVWGGTTEQERQLWSRGAEGRGKRAAAGARRTRSA